MAEQPQGWKPYYEQDTTFINTYGQTQIQTHTPQLNTDSHSYTNNTPYNSLSQL
jgi:hypothetical protein